MEVVPPTATYRALSSPLAAVLSRTLPGDPRLFQFGEITQVPFPPVYKKFLSIVSIFTFDLSWIFSASCIDTHINFYDKLL